MTSNLALDSNLDSYHVQNIVVERLPALVSQLGEMQTFLRAASSTEAVSSAQATRLALLDTSIRIRSTIDGVKSDLEAAYRGNADGSVRRNIDAAIMTMIASVESYLSTIELGSPDAEGKVDPASLEDAFSSAVESTIRVWAIVQADLERLLKVRITELGWKLHMSLALMGLLVGLSILLAAMTHQHIVSSLGHLEGIVAKVRELKPSNLGSDQHTGEEFGKLTVAFNNMLAELAAAREREIADQARSAQQTLLTTMGQMAASIAHELNQPLAAIVTNGNAGLRWLANTTPDLDEVRAALQRIVSDGHRASQLIGTIRSMFKKDGQKKAPVDVNQLIQEVLGLMQGELQNQRVSLQTELEAQPIQVLGDRVQLQQVILNLITNAIDAMGSVTEHERVLRVRSETKQSGVVVTVEDSGAGIDPKSTDRIFDTFYTTKSHGMGIGLAICRSIIEAHGGRISASPGNPHGAVFQVVLPTCELRACMKTARSEAQSIVFVIDDDASVRQALQSLFRSVGLQAQVFGSTAEFLSSEPSGCRQLSCARCPVARGQRTGLSRRTGEGENLCSDHFRHRPRRHSDVCQGHEGRSCRIPDQAISRPGAAGRYWNRAQPRSYQARKCEGRFKPAGTLRVIDSPRTGGDGPGHGGPHEQTDCRPIERQRGHRKGSSRQCHGKDGGAVAG